MSNYRIIPRHDTKANWETNNPILLKGESGNVDDNPNLYKIGDGTSRWNDLPFRGYNGTVTDKTGNDENSVMSQKAVTEAIVAEKERAMAAEAANTTVVNVTEKYSNGDVTTFNQAIIKIPENIRKCGLVCTFLTSTGWQTWTFIGNDLSQWTDKYYWIDERERIMRTPTISFGLGDTTEFNTEEVIVEKKQAYLLANETILETSALKYVNIFKTVNDDKDNRWLKRPITFKAKYVTNEFLQLMIVRNGNVIYKTNTLNSDSYYTVYIYPKETIYIFCDEYNAKWGDYEEIQQTFENTKLDLDKITIATRESIPFPIGGLSESKNFNTDEVEVEVLHGLYNKNFIFYNYSFITTYKIVSKLPDNSYKRMIAFKAGFAADSSYQFVVFRNGEPYYASASLFKDTYYCCYIHYNETIYITVRSEEDIQYGGFIQIQELLNPAYIDNPYKGKTIVTYGDSQVQGGGWQNIVAKFGCTVINSGIGGSTLTYRDRKQYVNSNGFYVGDPNEGYEPKEGETLINDTGSGEERLNYISSDANYIIILFGGNDFNQNKPIGNFTDTDNTTFKGAMTATVQWIRTNRPNATIIFMTSTVERTEKENSLGLKRIDYMKAILDAEMALNVPVINLWANTSFGYDNIVNYTVDNVHWNDTGKKIVGNVVSGFLMSINHFS